jgi:hypothetical protein
MTTRADGLCFTAALGRHHTLSVTPGSGMGRGGMQCANAHQKPEHQCRSACFGIGCCISDPVQLSIGTIVRLVDRNPLRSGRPLLTYFAAFCATRS